MTANRPTITAYCLSWHMTSSGSMHDLLINPLAPYIHIQQSPWTGQEVLPAPRPDETLIFYMLPPTAEWLATYDNPIIWVPMADAIYYPPNIQNHPSVRVVAFSDVVAKLAQDLGLPYIHQRYYCDPAQFSPASFEGERVLLYWNRTGLLDKSSLLTLCHQLRVNRLIFRAILDPRIPDHHAYTLPKRVGRMLIESYDTLTTYADYLALLRRANIFIAPRRVEGVGIAFLEAMASGCCVLGYDEVAMNEYIRHGENGLLFQTDPATPPTERLSTPSYRLMNKLSWKLRHQPIIPPDQTLLRTLNGLRGVNIAQLGAHARTSQEKGYTEWVTRIPQYAQFIQTGK